MPASVVAISCGLLLGTVTAFVWDRVLLWWGESGFWQAVADFTQAAVSGSNDADFLRQYGRLLKELGKYLVRNVVTIGVAFLPVTIFLLVAWPMAHASANGRATQLVVYPPQAVTVETAGQTHRLEPPDDALPLPDDRAAPLEIGVGGATLHCASAGDNCAFSSSEWQRLLLSLFDFHVAESPPEVPLLIIRPRGGDANWFWPYLNDLEFQFLASVSAASLGGMLFLKLRRR